MPRKRKAQVSAACNWKKRWNIANTPNVENNDVSIGLGLTENTNPETTMNNQVEVITVGQDNGMPSIEEFMPEPEKKNLRQMSIENGFNSKPMSNCAATPNVNEETLSTQYILADLNCLSKLITSFKCTFCDEASLIFEVSENQGFAHKISIVCDSCGTAHSSSYSSPRSVANVVGKTSSRQDFDVNQRVVQSFDAMGKGYPAIEQFCMTMGMNAMSSTAFYKKLKYYSRVEKEGLKLTLKNVQDKVKEAYRELDPNIKDGDIIDIGVSFDGSWHTRGFSSKNGLACVIDLLTGYVIDVIVLSKFCHTCARSKKDFVEDSTEHEAWKANHAPNCQANYTGSSPAMEVNAAELLWKRSEEIGFRYTTLLSDGDAKTYNHLCKIEVYGPDVELIKEECVNHVGKRLGTALRTLAKSSKSQGVVLGGKSHGALKETTILKLTSYYHNAIVKHSTDIDAMKTAIFATLNHCMSTDEKPQHHKCPVGVTSWCFYQRAIANNEVPGPHLIHVHTPLKMDVVKSLLPIYQRMSSVNLLERCKGRTQNANESIHALIWSRCPKSVFASRSRVERAVTEAVHNFNNGYIKANADKLQLTGITPTPNATKIANRREHRRIYQCNRKASVKFSKIRRKIRLAATRAEALRRKKEGETYSAGAFDLSV